MTINRIALTVLTVTAGLTMTAGAAFTPGLYGLSSSTPASIYMIDETTGAATWMADVGAPVDLGSLVGASFLGGELYGTDLLGPSGAFEAGTIDSGGAYAYVSDQDGSSNWHGLASSDALGLAWSIDIDDGDILKSVTPSGTVTSIGAGAGIDGRGMAYDDTNGILYATNSLDNSLYTVDITTGLASFVGAMNLSAGFIGLAFDETTQTLYANDGNGAALYSVDAATGAAIRIGDNNFADIDGLAWIPEPASLSLLVFGGLMLLRRR